MSPPTVPRNLAEASERDGRGGWLSALEDVVAHLESAWSIRVGDPFEPGGHTAWVAPVVDDDTPGSVLKVVWRHPEAEHEADGLRVWDGDGAVRLLRAAGPDGCGRADTAALLLERCRPGTTLSARPEPEQDEIIAGLLRRLWRPLAPGQPFETLQSMCDLWADEFAAKQVAGKATIDPGLARDGIDLFRSLPASAHRHVLLCTDLHAGNVLAATREPWLVIDPKPYVGDPTYDVLQHLLNCRDRLHTDPLAACRRLARLCDLDDERLRLWLFARCVQESPTWADLVDVARSVAP